ncbi:M36 family metallopeptidase [Streptomyces sp. NPDC006668]|uniref:M36 family metallopeptidase n=1 Tax=Streptomyces sp. NPDC006668 TaxID=3156903 RepID=UPI0033F51E59
MSAATRHPTHPTDTGNPAIRTPPIPSQQTLIRRDASLTNAEQRPGVRKLRKQLGTQGVLELDPATRTAREVAKLDGYLTSPSDEDPTGIVRQYLRVHPDVFGLSADQVEGLTLRKQYTDIAGIRHLSFVQSVDGVPLFDSGVRANISPDGRLISVLGSPVRDLPSELAPARVTGTQAKRAAIRDITDTGDSAPAGTAHQVVYPTTGGTFLRAWQTVSSPQGHGMWLHIVDATTGRVLYRQNLSFDLGATDAPTTTAQGAGQPLSSPRGPLPRTGKALVWDYSPGAPTGGKQRTRDLTAKGWLPKGARTLNGRVAHVYSDVNDNGEPDSGEEITPAADGTLSFPFKPFTGAECGSTPCAWDQAKAYSWQTNRSQNAVQVYYYLGKFHDHLAAAPIGFTRAAGNFDGRDGDAIQAHTDDGAAMNNGLPDIDHINQAAISVPPDGQPPSMYTFLAGAYPGIPNSVYPSGNFGDVAFIVYHEYTHGLSNRLVIDANGVSTLTGQQGGAMGEAWSDWYAFDFMTDEGFVRDDPRVAGDVSMEPPGWQGTVKLRSQPLDCPVGSTSTKCPGTKAAGVGGYTYGDYGKIARGGPEVHSDGEIWGETLWDLRTALGSKLTESLVTRAMDLSPTSPTFLDERNAILQADTVVNGGRAHDRIWKVFAHRGMGYFAATFTARDTKPDEDFSLPPGPKTPRFTLAGKVVDHLSGPPAAGVTVSVGGHSSGFPGADFSAVTKPDGTYSIPGIPKGTYRKVYASGLGYEPVVRTVHVDSTRIIDWTLQRDWAAAAGGAKVADFSGGDYSSDGCGPDKLIDLSSSAWSSNAMAGTNSTRIAPAHNTVELPRAVDIREVLVDPTAGCGDDTTSSLGDYQIETSADGTTWATAAEGHFKPTDTGRQNAVSLKAGTGQDIRYVRLTKLGSQAADNGQDCAKDSTPSGCKFLDTTELIVLGDPHQG